VNLETADGAQRARAIVCNTAKNRFAQFMARAFDAFAQPTVGQVDDRPFVDHSLAPCVAHQAGVERFEMCEDRWIEQRVQEVGLALGGVGREPALATPG
jgi:hypothetical protein